MNCESCERCYIGHTSQKLTSRMMSHKSDIRKHPERCALAARAHNLDHRVNFENVEILKIERNYQKRLIHPIFIMNEEEKL